MKHDDRHDRHHLALAEDLETLGGMAGRRQVLRWFASAALLPILGCGSSTGGASADTDSDADNDAGSGSSGSCALIPEETAGPYPGDGSNGKNALILSGIVRSDIRSSFADATGTAEGVPLTIKLTLVATNDGCTPLEGYAVYLWHCDREGNYSMYSAGVTEQNYLRGVQETDADGSVTFTSIFPACYSGRWPHIHFEVYPNADTITSASNKVRTSQLALPENVCNDVFATTGYSASVRNLSQVTLASDNVFRDGAELETAEVTGSVSAGYTATLTVGISV